jgi:membrane associated rhomboid family serine protease
MDVHACQLMLNHKTDDEASIPILNAGGVIFGLMGVVVLFIQQSLTILLPLLVPLVVCAVLCTVLIKSHQGTNTGQENKPTSPVRIDII